MSPERKMFGRPEKIDTKPWQSYTDKRVISMAEQSSEKSPRSNPEHKSLKSVEKTVSPKKIDVARKAWGDLSATPFEERQAIEKIINEGIGPEAYYKMYGPDAKTAELTSRAGPGAMGGAIFNPDNYTNPGLKSAVRRIAQARGPEPTFIERRIREIERIIATGQLGNEDTSSAEDLVSVLEATVEQAERSLRGGETLRRDILESREARDRYFNDLFATVDAIPHEFFDKAFNPLVQGVAYDRFIQTLIQASQGGQGIPPDQASLIREDLERYQVERRVNEALHNVNAILYLPTVKVEQLLDSMQQFESVLGDYALKTPGVAEMMNVYENILREEMVENNGYLPPEAITGKVEPKTAPLTDAEGNQMVDERGHPIIATYLELISKENTVETKAKKRFEEAIRTQGLFLRDENGRAVKYRSDQPLQSWEIDRIFIMSRAMMIMSGRLLSLAAEGKTAEGLGNYSSLFLQDILQAYSPLYHLIGKYGITEDNLGAYLFEPRKETDSIFGFLRAWNPKKSHKILEEYEKNPKKILESPDHFFYLTQKNPNRAGDIVTWQSWRYIDDPDTPSAIRDFITQGRERMGLRWNVKFPDAPRAETYEAFIKRPEYFVPEYERERINEPRSRELRGRMEDEWQRLHPGAPPIANYERYANEYINWTGTALRFEKLRGRLDKLQEGQRGEAFNEAEALLNKMVDIQPHRLYLISEEIRNRVNQNLGIPEARFQTPEQKDRIRRILKNLNLLETAFFRSREVFLGAGETFGNLSLRNLPQNIIPAEELTEAMDFMDKVKDDFNHNRERYHGEFIYKREYRHGFALWSGDMPLDEFGWSALGPTGSFVRRARDNKYQAEAFQEEIKLLNAVPNITSPDQLLEALDKVYEKIQSYSADRAKEVYAQKLEGYLLFFGEPGVTKIPGWGLYQKAQGKSFARFIFGNEAGMFNSGEMRYALRRAVDKTRITKEDYERMIRRLKLGWGEVLTDAGVTGFQLLFFVMLRYLLGQTGKSLKI